MHLDFLTQPPLRRQFCNPPTPSPSLKLNHSNKIYSDNPWLQAVRGRQRSMTAYCAAMFADCRAACKCTGVSIITHTSEPFHAQSIKWMEECSVVSYTTVCYRLEWKSRSSASQGAALQRRMVTALTCTAGFLLRGVTALLRSPPVITCSCGLSVQRIQSTIPRLKRTMSMSKLKC